MLLGMVANTRIERLGDYLAQQDPEARFQIDEALDEATYSSIVIS